MTEEDKALLRQYEGAGGLGSEDASVHGTLYEFYTPRTVTSKVWEIVDKYIPGAKSVLEPSAGIGRFAEDRRNDKFTLNEYDQTSSRISGILHPDAEIKHGAFQEMFKPGKDYTGKKYDVVIGNPPYGKYQGLWKGRGEGKGHTRYEEYFIDRGLDTLREGGIMAFVVPSSFLRGGNDKIKEKIAGKGRLLEAWRLPNGTFNTTGVGTDIIIVRKEKGESAAFSNNTYFEKSPLMVVGEETTRTGRFGEEKYVGLKDGVTFDEAIEGINAGAAEAVPIGEQTTKEKLLDNTEVKESEAEKHKNRSEAMLGNQNAKKYGMAVEALENGKFGIKTSQGNLLAYLPPKESGTAFMGGGIAEFEDPEAAKKRMNEIADRRAAGDKKKEKKYAQIAENNRNFIENAVRNGARREGKYLFDPQTNGRLELAGAELDFYNKIAGSSSKNRSDAMMGNQNAKKDGGPEEEPPAPPHGAVYTLEEFNKKYNKHFDPQDLKIMRHTRWDGTIDLDLITPEETNYMKSSGNYVDIGENTWMSVANFASGNIYQKLDDLETAKEGMPTAEYKRQKELLQAALPAKKSVFDFTVSPISDFAEEYKIETLNGPESLNGAFKRWLNDLDSSNIPSEITMSDIFDYVNRKAVRAERSDDKVAAQLERAQTVRVRREAAENLFNQFIREQLAVQEQERVADKWNRQFNGTVQPDHTKIPAFVDGISKTFKDKPLRVSDIQLKGVGTLVNRGNGILAYDVGVGKTLAGILATVSQIQTGRAKRPLICVPKAVYKNWISEIKQLFPGIKINELNNLRSLGNYKNADGSLNVPEGSLSVCTYEGLQAVSFKQETIDNVLMADFAASQESTGEEDSKRKQAQELEKIRTALGKATKATENAVLWENTGFDHITIDECFPYDTPVLTEKGWMKIGEIVEKRLSVRVYSCNYEQGVIELKPVISWMPKRLEHRIVKVNLANGESLACTHNHKIWTEGGYVRAENVTGKDVFVLRENVRTMREGILLQILRGKLQPEKAVLFSPLRGNLPEQSTSYQGGRTGAGACYGGCDAGKEDALSFSQNEGTQPYEEHGSQREGSIEEGRQAIRGRTWREWEIYEAANTFNGTLGIASGIPDTDEGDNGTRCSEQLQSGPGDCRKESCHRIRRAFPYAQADSGSRCEENSVFERVRVESVEILERGSFEQYGFRGTDDTTIYDIEVADNHNFIANGVLVSNCHNFKNVFGEARAKEKGEANEFQGLTGGTPSDRAMKAFAITQLIQRDNNGRNVFGLTATPFTNSPIEIYNILSLVARDDLKKAGIFNLHEFMAQFALLKSELAQTAKGDVESRTVMKEFKNLPALQNLINTYIDKVDGEEAGIIRPNKTPHLVDLNMTDEQRAVYEDIIRYMDTADPKEDPGATLRGLNALRALTVSPALLKRTRFAKSLTGETDFVKSSPKMTFVCDSAAKLYKDNPKNGQVIYLPEGVEYFKDVKKYLAKRGIPEDAVAFLSPEYLPAGDKGNDKKEEIMRDFNDPNGKIKVIIGSGTIKEGVNLNGNTTTLYNCMLGWNPTETVQVEGRIHRQGNQQGEVHIVYPLMNDTVDSFMYQKHYEKSERISAVFSYKGETLNVEDINPEELRFNLIKDPEKRASLQIKQEVEEINSRVLISQSTADKIMNTYRAREELVGDMNEYAEKVSAIKQAGKAFGELSDKQLIELYGSKEDDDDVSFDVRMEEFSGIRGSSWIEAKNPKEFRKEYEHMAGELMKFLQRQAASAKGKSETLAATLKRYNVDPNSEDSAMNSSKKYGVEAAELKAKIEKIKQNREAYIEQAKRQLEAYAKEHPGKTVTQAIADTTTEIKGSLRPMDVVEKEIKAKREAAAQAGAAGEKPLQKSNGKKKLVLLMKRRTA